MENRKTILHISEVDISLNAGMGRVEYHWKNAFEHAGYHFVHLGPAEIGKVPHKSLFGLKAYRYLRKSGLKPAALIVHEPAAMFFVNSDIPVFIESHGIERRHWENDKQLNGVSTPSLKTLLLYPLWRLLPCDMGLKKAFKLLLINQDDRHFAQKRYKREQKDIYVFKNGVDPIEPSRRPQKFTVLFNGSWIPRKGAQVLIKAAELLLEKGLVIDYLLIGTGKSEEEVLAEWPPLLREFARVVPRFSSREEASYLDQASVVVLPSSFEGQPLSILQAMAAGKCCITTDCCGQKDFIEDGRTGLLFDPGDSFTLAMLIEWCKNDMHLVSQIGKEARLSVQGRSWDRVSAEVVQFVTDHI